MFGREEAEELFEEKLYNDDERGEKKKHWLPKLVIVLVLIAFIAGIVFATVPQARGMLTGEDYVTSTQLKKAVNIENLSSAEFVYNGISQAPRAEWCYQPLISPRGSISSFRKGYLVGTASYKRITPNARVRRLLQTELEV